MAIAPLKENYGDAVAVNYHDVSDDQAARDRLNELGREEGREISLPAVTVNGRLTAEGWISFYELREEIDRILGTVAH